MANFTAVSAAIGGALRLGPSWVPGPLLMLLLHRRISGILGLSAGLDEAGASPSWLGSSPRHSLQSSPVGGRLQPQMRWLGRDHIGWLRRPGWGRAARRATAFAGSRVVPSLADRDRDFLIATNGLVVVARHVIGA